MILGFDAANRWWRARSTRECSLFLLLAAIVTGLAGWYGVTSPLSRAAERSEMQRAHAATLLREVEDSRTAIEHMAIPTDALLDDVLTLSAAEAGFTLEKHSEQNAGETTVQGRVSDPAALFAWIELLRRNHGLTIANLTAERENDGGLRVEAVFVRSVS